ncbi:GD13789 [Drosophila simulans]|uniref:GD13789 n=1 Tax=Drosophila simulans TaxID=7240 RepID=B4QQ03_DROSI|nr:GD13789 [Drosophila simulans]
MKLPPDGSELAMQQEHPGITVSIKFDSVRMASKQRQPELDCLRAHYQLINMKAAARHRYVMSYLFIASIYYYFSKGKWNGKRKRGNKTFWPKPCERRAREL